MSPKLVILLSASIILSLNSCEDKEMVATSNEQSKRIEALRAELSLAKVKLDANWEKDPSDDLENVEFRIDELKRVITSSEEEMKTYKKERNEAEESFEDYQKRYPVG
jgi:peptidoglycan hydrolase CwlO-like protein